MKQVPASVLFVEGRAEGWSSDKGQEKEKSRSSMTAGQPAAESGKHNCRRTNLHDCTISSFSHTFDQTTR